MRIIGLIVLALCLARPDAVLSADVPTEPEIWERVQQDSYFQMLRSALLRKFPDACENLRTWPLNQSATVYEKIGTEDSGMRVELRCGNGYHFRVATVLGFEEDRPGRTLSPLGRVFHGMEFSYADSTIPSYIKDRVRRDLQPVSVTEDPLITTFREAAEKRFGDACEVSEQGLEMGEELWLHREVFTYRRFVSG